MASLRSRRSASLVRLTLLSLAAVGPVAAEPAEPIALPNLTCARPSVAELSAAAELAEARSTLAATGAFFSEAWTVGAVAGPRRVERVDGTESATDVAVEASAPLLADGATRGRLGDALEAAEAVLPWAARLAARAELAGLLAEAWAAERAEALRALSLGTADEWLATARRRAAEGAEAPYQAELVAVERREAAIALAAARAERRSTWSALAARCELPGEPQPLAAPPLAPAPDAAAIRARLRGSASVRAVELRAELERAVVALDTARGRSRWLLRGEAAQEGDEDVARVGFAFRIPRSGENAALEARRESELARIGREAELEIAELAARLDAALALQDAVGGAESGEAGSAASIAAIRAALDALVAEGRSRASEILPIRRQLLAAEIAEVERAAALAKSAAEIEFLTAEAQP